MMYYSRRDVDHDIGRSAYVHFIALARELNYSLVKFEEVDNFEKVVIVRHDVDVDIITATDMARLEFEHNLCSTYFIMLHNELYNTLSFSVKKMIRKIRRMGHSIGLHFYPGYYDDSEDRSLLQGRILNELKLLSDIVGDPVNLVSFHQPRQCFLQHDFSIPGEFISAYDNAYFRKIKYMSDSSGDWRGESMHQLLVSEKFAKIQFLAHPFLWMHGDAPKLQDRLDSFLTKHDRNAREQLKHALNDPSRGMILYE